MSARVLASCLLLAFCSLASCLTPTPTWYGKPDQELEALLSQLRDVRGGAFEGEASRAPESPQEGELVRAIEALSLTYPSHVPVLVACASLAYERSDSVRAQKLLDQALAIRPDHVPATLLRVRIASEAGNLPYARRRLTEQLQLTPDDSVLHEAYAGVLYLLGDYEEALLELDLSDRLRRAPQGGWSTNYHRGLIAEAQGDLGAALGYYQLSCAQNTEFEPAARRRRWLEGRGTQDMPQP